MSHAHETHHADSLDSMQSCIDACRRSHETCLHTAMVHCLAAGGERTEANHFRLMINCAEICQTASNFMLSDSAYCRQLCTLCAEICDACADSCAKVAGMEDCAKACRECADSCRTMSGVKAK